MTPYHAYRRWLIARAIRKHAARQSAETLRHGHHLTTYAVTRTEPAQEPPTRLPPGRQAIRLPGELSHFGQAASWTPPIPAGARSANWEDLHTFAPGCRPRRHSEFGLIAPEPPIALVCVACELAQAPLRGTSEERACGYCGLKLRTHGTRVFWWREPLEVPAWRPGR